MDFCPCQLTCMAMGRIATNARRLEVGKTRRVQSALGSQKTARPDVKLIVDELRVQFVRLIDTGKDKPKSTSVNLSQANSNQVLWRCRASSTCDAATVATSVLQQSSRCTERSGTITGLSGVLSRDERTSSSVRAFAAATSLKGRATAIQATSSPSSHGRAGACERCAAGVGAASTQLLGQHRTI